MDNCPIQSDLPRPTPPTHARSLAVAWFQGCWARGPGALSAALLCAGLIVVPALAALDLAVVVVCRNLDPSACPALFI